MLILFISGFFLTLLECQAYVLVQMRQQDANHSNVDALIHKTVPSDKFNKFAERMGQAQKKAAEGLANNKVSKARETEEETAENELTIPEAPASKEPTLMDLIALVGRKFARGPLGPTFRSQAEGYVLEPETVKLNSGESAVYRVRPETVLVALKELLSSVTLGKYLDNLTRKAAVVFRTVENDLQSTSSFRSIKKFFNF